LPNADCQLETKLAIGNRQLEMIDESASRLVNPLRHLGLDLAVYQAGVS
jgi:hypothetical protein